MKFSARQLLSMGARPVGQSTSPKKRRGAQEIRPRKFADRRTIIIDGAVVEIVLPLQLVTLANQREHWAVKQRRAAEQSGAAKLAVRTLVIALPWFPEREARGVLVTVTRMGPRHLDRHDAVAPCAKHVVDGIANALEIGKPKLRVKMIRKQRVEEWYHDDSDPRITWEYGQEHPMPYGVRIRIEPRSAVTMAGIPKPEGS